MNYCTNCGKESKKNVCPHCGVKRDKTHKYCAWCGNELEENAEICPNCKERIVKSKAAKIYSVLRWFTPIPILCGMLYWMNVPYEQIVTSMPVNYLGMALALTASLFMMFYPNIVNFIRKKTHKKFSLRKILNAVCALVLIALFATGIGLNNYILNSGKYVYSIGKAEDYAIDILHNSLPLKNRDSFRVINSFSKTDEESKANKESKFIYTNVYVEFVAENSFGAGVSTPYEVKVSYDKETHEYSLVDYREISGVSDFALNDL